MRLARYWIREPGEATGPDGRRIHVAARGWSNDSVEAARALARDIARRIAERLASRQAGRGPYLYGERPLPEPVVREFRDGRDELCAVVTRNAYGALVLNARDLMFADIDRPDAPAPTTLAAGILSGVLSLFGKGVPGPPPSAVSPVLAEIQRVTEANGVAARVYRTAAGYRAIVTSAPFEPGARPGEVLMEQLGTDPLYARLCRMQQSFRARLTPKPWRCGLRVPPATFPFDTPQTESRFHAWASSYAATAARYATCRYVTTFGDVRVDPAFEDLIHYHDQETKATADLPLA